MKPFRSCLRQVRHFIQYVRLSQPLAVSALSFCPVPCFSVMEHLLTVVMLLVYKPLLAITITHGATLLSGGIWLASGVSVPRLPIWKLTFDCCSAWFRLSGHLVQRAGWEACYWWRVKQLVIELCEQIQQRLVGCPMRVSYCSKLEVVASCLKLLLLTHIGKCSCPSLFCLLNLFIISCFQCDAPTLLCMLGSVLSFSTIVFTAKAGSCL